MLAQGFPIRVPRGHLEFFFSIAREFGNTELYNRFLGHLPASLRFSEFSSPDFTELASSTTIGNFSSKFYSFSPSILDRLPISTLFHLLSHKSLCLQNEDSLYEFLKHKSEDNPEYCVLFRFVSSEYLSSVDYYEEIDRPMWEWISGCLISGARPVLPSMLCPLTRSMDGVFARLTSIFRGNLHDLGIVTVTASDRITDVANIFDPNPSLFLRTSDRPDTQQWICFEFHGTMGRPTHYMIQSSYMNAPKSWKVESSMNGIGWMEIDHRSSCKLLKSANAIASFDIANPTKMRFIRITQTGPNWARKNDLCLARFDIFGTFFDCSQSETA
jgi:hypothetical protein